MAAVAAAAAAAAAAAIDGNWIKIEPQVIFMNDGQPRFVCSQCGVKYKKISGLRGHLRECGRGAKCPVCPKIVTQRRNLPKHMEKHKREGFYDYAIKENELLVQTLNMFPYDNGND